MFIKALKEYGELTHDDLVKAYGDYDDNPLMVNNKVIDSICSILINFVLFVKLIITLQ